MVFQERHSARVHYFVNPWNQWYGSVIRRYVGRTLFGNKFSSGAHFLKECGWNVLRNESWLNSGFVPYNFFTSFTLFHTFPTFQNCLIYLSDYVKQIVVDLYPSVTLRFLCMLPDKSEDQSKPTTKIVLSI